MTKQKEAPYFVERRGTYSQIVTIKARSIAEARRKAGEGDYDPEDCYEMRYVQGSPNSWKTWSEQP